MWNVWFLKVNIKIHTTSLTCVEVKGKVNALALDNRVRLRLPTSLEHHVSKVEFTI